MFVLFATSCKLPIKKQNNCFYSINKLFKDYDSSRFQISRFEKELEVNIFDSANQFGQRGVYKFDKSRNLLFYAFLKDSSNAYSFSLEYDSWGNAINKTGNEVVQWYLRKRGTDSLFVTFYLFAINSSYSNVSFIKKDDTIKNITLFENLSFSNLLGQTIAIPIAKGNSNMKLFIYGLKKNLCTNESTFFKDSIDFQNK
jgi:hypothetical protein